jgi:hypothetical protein
LYCKIQKGGTPEDAEGDLVDIIFEYSQFYLKDQEIKIFIG